MSIDREIYDKFVTYCQQEGYVASRLIEKMMREYLSEKGLDMHKE